MNGCQSGPEFDPETATLGVNQWAISEAVQAAYAVEDYITNYRFDAAADAAYKFAWGSFCDWYLELIKPILSGDDADAKAETQASFGWVFDQILKMLHPFMPFITEELWANTAAARKTDLILASWPKTKLVPDWSRANSDVSQVIDVISAIRSVRAEMNIPPSKKAPLLMIGGNEDLLSDLMAYSDALERMARVESLEMASAAPQGALQTVVDGVSYAIPMEGLIDLGAEKARLSKEIEKTQSEIDKIDKKLGNEAFISKAPEKVITLQKDRRAAYSAELVKLDEALANLG
jgi:valyl-tRNA synthetase